MTVIILISIKILAFNYIFYQMKRNDMVAEIRMNWIHQDDERWDKYSYDYMYNPSIRNWLGLKFPKDEHFK